MSRQIVGAAKRVGDVRTRDVPSGDVSAVPPVDAYADKLLKLIPAEVIGVYLSMQVILKSSGDAESPAFIIGTFLFGVIATVFYLRVVLKVFDVLQIVVSTGAFCVWAYAIFAPEDAGQFSWHNSTLAGLMLIGYTFIAPHIPLGQSNQKG